MFYCQIFVIDELIGVFVGYFHETSGDASLFFSRCDVQEGALAR